MSAHTPGPWSIYDDGPDGSDVILSRVDEENYDIAYISNDASEGRPEEERKANARLIAAAPAMLEALKKVRVLVNGFRSPADMGTATYLIDKALRLAEGRES